MGEEDDYFGEYLDSKMEVNALMSEISDLRAENARLEEENARLRAMLEASEHIAMQRAIARTVEH